jgi:hypothetical protein
MRSDLRVEPVRAVFPDRRPNERERRERSKDEKDTFEKALQDAKEREHGRPNDSGT